MMVRAVMTASRARRHYLLDSVADLLASAYAGVGARRRDGGGETTERRRRSEHPIGR